MHGRISMSGRPPPDELESEFDSFFVVITTNQYGNIDFWVVLWYNNRWSGFYRYY